MRQLKITNSITNRDSKTLEKYFNEISSITMLTAEEEVELAIRIREGDQMALERLVKANLRFVVSVAKQYQHTKIPLNDLINEGNVGLVKAAKKFDEKRGFKFISYAVWWIRQSIMQALAEQSRMVRLPGNKLSMLYKIDSAASMLAQRFEREPTDDELADILEISADQVKTVMSASTKQVSMDKPFQENDSNSLLDVLENEDGNTVDNLIHYDSLKTEVSRLLKNLTVKESSVIRAFYGLAGEKKLSLEDIGSEFGISRERVRQIKDKALRKLERSPSLGLLEAYL